jgi:glycine cleavage system regulatory protein
MTTTLILSVIGPDRPGLVESVAAVVAGHGGNWLESRMARLGGQFAGIVRIELPRDRESALREALRTGAARGVSVTVAAAEPGAGRNAGEPGTVRARLSLVGHDRPGIVRQVTAVLAAHGVNVEDFSSGTESAPMSGDRLFRATALVSLPLRTDHAALRRALEEIAEDLMVDVDLSAVEGT